MKTLSSEVLNLYHITRSHKNEELYEKLPSSYKCALYLIHGCFLQKKTKETSNDLNDKKTITIYDNLDLVLREIKEKLNSKNKNKNKLKNDNLDFVKSSIYAITASLQTLFLLITNNIEKENILKLITLITSVIKSFTDGKNPIYDLFHLSEYVEMANSPCLLIIHKLIEVDKLKDIDIDSKKIIINSLPYIKIIGDDIKPIIKEYFDKHQSINLDELPEELLDPLLFTPITDPIMIPNVDLIFDKASIMMQIHSEKINPYTREYMDEEIIIEHNKKENINEKINEFKKKYNLNI
jgi:hypothetical protein